MGTVDSGIEAGAVISHDERVISSLRYRKPRIEHRTKESCRNLAETPAHLPYCFITLDNKLFPKSLFLAHFPENTERRKFLSRRNQNTVQLLGAGFDVMSPIEASTGEVSHCGPHKFSDLERRYGLTRDGGVRSYNGNRYGNELGHLAGPRERL